MKTKWRSLMNIATVCLFPVCICAQSSMEFQSGTTIEVTTGADICADTITINGSYSGGGTQCGGALPIELVSFTASMNKKNVVLTWQTATEVNNYGFEIEKKSMKDELRSMKWEQVGFVEGSGTTPSPKQYSFVDKNVNTGKYLYRLKQIDRDGKFIYSHEAEVTIAAPKEFSLLQNYPNPFNPTTVINYQLPISGHVTLKVFDPLGREMTTLVNEMKEAGKHSVQLDATLFGNGISSKGGYASGIYFYQLVTGEKTIVKKMVLIK